MQNSNNNRSMVSKKPAIKHHHIAIGTLLIGVLLVVTGLTRSNQVEANRISQPIDIGITADAPAAEPQTDVEDELAQDESAHPAQAATEPSRQWQPVTVRRGDNLSLIFARVGLDGTDLQEILDTEVEARSLRNIYPGQTIEFDIAKDGNLQALRYIKSPLEATLFSRGDEGFTVEEIQRSPEIVSVFKRSTVNSSLFGAGKDAGLSNRMIMELAGVFGGVIDFALDPRAGDTFSLLYEEKYLDGEKIGEGSIIAAEYTNSGERFSAFRFIDGDGDTGYFSEDGVSMRKAFLRAPLDFTRVSSGFNLKRLHPVAKVVRPHRGIDYAAPTGTPVYSAGDGRVVASGYSRANGNYVFVQHANNIKTHYLHLHKRSVKQGAKVKQGQVIGSVGSTGLATGPHLHYEFLLDGVHRNPRTILDKLPRAKSLSSTELAAFQQQIGGVRQQLARYGGAWDVAVNAEQQSGY